MAAERGVRVFTVGVGTPNGEILVGEGWSMRVRLDEETLKQIANLTGAEYFYAGTAVDLKKIYQSLNSRFVLEKKETEITALSGSPEGQLERVQWRNRVTGAERRATLAACNRPDQMAADQLRRRQSDALLPRRGEGELHVLQPELHRELGRLVDALHHQLAVVLVGRRS